MKEMAKVVKIVTTFEKLSAASAAASGVAKSADATHASDQHLPR